LAAVPSIGRAAGLDEPLAPEADVTRSLYEQYANQIFRYCLHQLGSREEAEDAVQSTFLNAFRGIKRGVVPEVESAWLFKIAHNVCLSRRRSAWRRGRIESPTDFDVVEELAPAPNRRADELIGLQDVLEQMPETQRRAILLREWQGLSYREIGEELELSQAAVETLIFRARRSLASGLEQPFERRRRARALDWGSLVAGLKSVFLGGSVAAKVAATVAVVGATTVVAAAPVIARHEHRTAPNKAPAPVPVRRVRLSTAIVAPAVRLMHSAPAKPVAPAAGRPAHHRTAVRTHAATRVRHARRSALAPAVTATHHEQPAPAAAERPTTHPAAAHATAHGRANGTGAGQQPARPVQGNGHASGHAKHVRPAPPVDTQPLRAPAATDPASPAPGDPASAGRSDVPHGNALGHDKSGGAAAAPVDTPGP
jgi:RNA polymerase sigma factor (sigma-70 family)